MKTKKGVEGHVDWVISIGIFLTYLLGMFVLIKPGVIPVHNYNTLLDIVEENVKKDYDSGLYWTLYKVPLFITAGGGGCIKIDFPYAVSQDNLNVYSITTDTNNNEILNPLDILLGDKLNIRYPSSSFSTNGKYVIYFSDNNAYSGSGDPRSGIISEDLLDECIDNNDPAVFDYNLGISEKTRGLVDGGLNRLDDGAYEDIKKRYGYPLSKEFSIIITREGVEKEKYKVKDPDPKTNVYTRQWSDFILKYDGKRDPVQISIRIW